MSACCVTVTRSALVCLLSITAAGLWAADDQPLVITLKDHQFSPAELVVPANQKLVITVRNDQSEVAELNREKVIPAKGEVVLKLAPLDPGTYHYLDDFHRDTVGVITAK